MVCRFQFKLVKLFFLPKLYHVVNKTKYSCFVDVNFLCNKRFLNSYNLKLKLIFEKNVFKYCLAVTDIKTL